MTFKGLLKKSKPHFDSITIDRYFGKKVRTVFRFIFSGAAIIGLAFSFGTFSFVMSKADSLFFVSVFMLLCLIFLEVFYNSMRHEGLASRVVESISDNSNSIDFALSELLYGTDDIDLSRAFFDTKIGIKVMERCAISLKDLEEFIQGDRTPVIGSSLRFENDNVRFVQYVLAIYDIDKSLQDFLQSRFCTRSDFAGAALWVQEEIESKLRKERIWSRENLGTFPSIGSSWKFGTTFLMPDYCKYFELSKTTYDSGYRSREALQLESAFQGLKSNVLIVSESEVANEIVGKVSQMIELGTALPSLEHKSILYYDWKKMLGDIFDGPRIVDSIKSTFEKAQIGRNSIIFIPELLHFVIETKTKNVSLLEILRPYFASNDIQIVATSDPIDAKFFASAPEFEDYFEKISPSGGIIALLPETQRTLINIEDKYNIIFSYSAVIAVLNHASRFEEFKNIVPVDQIEKLAIIGRTKGLAFISEKEVNEFFSASV